MTSAWRQAPRWRLPRSVGGGSSLVRGSPALSRFANVLGGVADVLGRFVNFGRRGRVVAAAGRVAAGHGRGLSRPQVAAAQLSAEVAGKAVKA